MPSYATRKDEEWYTVNMSNYLCPVIGQFSICPETAFTLQRLDQCINVAVSNHTQILENKKAHGCLLNTCNGDSQYINLKGGRY